MKAIFLDLDGVLNSRRYDAARDRSKRTYIDPTRLELLRRIISATDAKIVLSTTWRVHWDKDREKCDEEGKYIADSFAEFGMEIFDKTADLGLHFSRADEIRLWLSERDDIESFVVIDDYLYDWGNLSDRLVRTNPNFGWGLEEEHVEKAIRLLNGL